MRKILKKVISLENSGRLDGFYQSPFAKDFEHFKAFDARPLEKSDLEQYFDYERFKFLLPGIKVNNSEIGCSISHAKIIEDFAQSNLYEDKDYLIIAEDDAVPTPDFETILSKITQLDKTFDYVILADAFGAEEHTGILNFPNYSSHLSFFSKILGFSHNKIFRIGNFVGNPWGTGLYMVSKIGAQKITQYLSENKICWRADDFDKWPQLMNLDIYQVKPALANFAIYSESINGSIAQDYHRRKQYLLDKNLINVLKFLKIKAVLKTKATFEGVK